jgi:glycosyltransferase involved in cell wall biosynthesis
MTSRVSVIIPAYRAERTIGRAIESVLAQSLPAYEVIVVDDGSPDRQVEVITRYGPSVRLLSQSNGKTALARNTGIEAATGDFIAFLDADDYWETSKLERQLAILTKFPEVGLVAGSFFTEEPGKDRMQGDQVGSHFADQILSARGAMAFRLASQIWTGTVMVRRDVLGKERFVSGLEPAEDRDLWVRLVLRTHTYLLSEPLATAVLEPGSISRVSVEKDCRQMLEVVARHRKTLGLLQTIQWQSHTLYRWAACDTRPSSALASLLASLCLWPFPYRRFDDMRFLGRLKRLIVLTRMLFLQASNKRGSVP